MGSAVVATRKAALAFFRAQLVEAGYAGVDVLDRAPLRYRLPHFALVEARQDRERLNKRAVRYVVRLTFQLTSNPHDTHAAPDDDLINAFDAAFETRLDLSASGFGIREQYLEEIVPFTDRDAGGAEVHRTDIILLVEVT